jgi:hypothetical protein
LSAGAFTRIDEKGSVGISDAISDNLRIGGSDSVDRDCFIQHHVIVATGVSGCTAGHRGFNLDQHDPDFGFKLRSIDEFIVRIVCSRNEHDQA